MSEDIRKKILDRMTALLNKAESTTFAPERDALLEKVAQLQTQYAIAEWEISGNKKEERPKPTTAMWEVAGVGNHLWSELVLLNTQCCKLFGVRPLYWDTGGRAKDWPIRVQCAGFPEDLQNAEALFVGLRMQLIAQLSVRADAALPLGENLANMKRAGMRWIDQYAELHAVGHEDIDDEWSRNQGVRFTAVYAKFCQETGVEQVKVNPKSYQTAFAEGFARAIQDRVYEITTARARKAAEDSTNDGTSVAVVLRSRQEDVDDSFNEMTGGQKLGTVKLATRNDTGGAKGKGHSAGRNADMSGGMGNVSGSRKALR